MDTEKFILECEKNCKQRFFKLEEIALCNQRKVLNAFRVNKIALRHFASSTGYGYDDIGRTSLSRVFADVFKGEDAIVSPLFMSGTHTISTALFGLLRSGDVALSITGQPYNTLKKAIFTSGTGSLKDFNVDFLTLELAKNGAFDDEKIIEAIQNIKPKIIYVQRSKGYSFRKALSIDALEKIFLKIREVTDAPIVVDNCYGEFIDFKEPLEIGANLIMGSLIKNPGGGLAPTGGYITGDSKLIKAIEGRYSAPGVGFDIGCYPYGYQYFFQGIFMAPHTVLQSAKAALLFSEVFSKLGYEVLGYEDKNQDMPTDITCAIKFKDEKKMIDFCRLVQKCSPVDSFVVPYPYQMPGYENPIIMAAGSFIQGSSIEFSADGPVKDPYVAYFQGALTYEHAKVALEEILEAFEIC